MVEFVEDNEGVHYYVTVENGYRGVFSRVTAKSRSLVPFRQTHFQLRHAHLIGVCEQFKGLLRLTIQNKRDN